MPIAKSVKSQVRSTESSHIVNTTIRLPHNAVTLGEVIFEKKLLPFGHCPKGGAGVQPESKSFGVVFFGLSFGHFQ